jgi:hypothetical protein
MKSVRSGFMQPPAADRAAGRTNNSAPERRSVHVAAALERAQAPLKVKDIGGGREIGVTTAAFGRVEPVADFFEDAGKHEILQIRAYPPVRPRGYNLDVNPIIGKSLIFTSEMLE